MESQRNEKIAPFPGYAHCKLPLPAGAGIPLFPALSEYGEASV